VPGWNAFAGLSLSEAEELLDLLESHGISSRLVQVDTAGITVRWQSQGRGK
jgi:hypothetical protein